MSCFVAHPVYEETKYEEVLIKIIIQVYTVNYVSENFHFITVFLWTALNVIFDKSIFLSMSVRRNLSGLSFKSGIIELALKSPSENNKN